MDKPEFFRVGEEYELECQSRGSKPAAEVTWYKGHVAYDPQLVSVRSKECTFMLLHRKSLHEFFPTRSVSRTSRR